MRDLRRQGVPEEERLPWLEDGAQPVAAPPRRANAGWIVAVALILALIAAGGWWWSQRATREAGAPGLIKAPLGPYKMKPTDAGGMDVEGEGYASFAASEGAEPRGAINLSAVPEAPLGRARRGAATAGAPPDAPEPPITAGGAVVQLGAFSTEAKAKAAWKGLAARFAFLREREPVIVVAGGGAAGATVYRLRTVAGSPQASAQMCGRLRVAGEACQPVAP